MTNWHMSKILKQYLK